VMRTIAGIDEAGRGPLAGPVVAAAVVLHEGDTISGVADSKSLTSKQRLQSDAKIRKLALDWSIGAATSSEVDEFNIHKASLLAMKRAVLGLRFHVDYVLVDGMYFPDILLDGETVIKGDERVGVISAASILAKVFRDRQMCWIDKIYPNYGFKRHKGYPTKYHKEMIKKLGPTPEHRMTFSGVKNPI